LASNPGGESVSKKGRGKCAKGVKEKEAAAVHQRKKSLCLVIGERKLLSVIWRTTAT